MADDRKLDALLNDALASYSNEEPAAGLTARIASRLEEAPPRPWRLWSFGALATCAVALLFAFLLHPATHTPVAQPAVEPSIADVSEPSAAVPAPPREHRHPQATFTAHRFNRGERPVLVRAHSIPAPAPLTTEERLLMEFVAEHPEQARQALAAANQQHAPLEMQPLSIAPIHITSLSDSESPKSDD